MSNENSTIGFGSLFLPTSIMRVDDSVGPAKPKYQEGRRHGDRNILRRSAVESWAWEERSDSKEILPVKVDSLRRDYNLESSYGGTMLDVEEDENSWINAVVISGLTDVEKEKLDSSESAYELEVVEREDIEPYVDSHEEDLDEIFESNTLKFTLESQNPHKEPEIIPTTIESEQA